MNSEPYTPPTRKSFSLKALAFWGERLASPPAADWEKRFAEDALFAGRRLYRELRVAEIVIEENSAAVVFRVPAQTPPQLQILFDLDPAGNVLWRSSASAPRRESAPFAVAALYVVEEFVASEYADLPLSAGTEEKDDEKGAGTTGSAAPAASVPAAPTASRCWRSKRCAAPKISDATGPTRPSFPKNSCRNCATWISKRRTFPASRTVS